MTQVYVIVEEVDYEGCEILGMYISYEVAKKALKEIANKYKKLKYDESKDFITTRYSEISIEAHDVITAPNTTTNEE